MLWDMLMLYQSICSLRYLILVLHNISETYSSLITKLFPSFGAELWPVVFKIKLNENWVKFHSLQNIFGASQKKTNEVGGDLGGWSLHRSNSSKAFNELESSV